MKALTLWPEWAWAVCALFKRVENRGWTPPRAIIGNPFMLHAGAKIGGGVRSGMDAIDQAMLSVCRVAEENGWHFSKRGLGDYELEATLPVWCDAKNSYVSPTVEFVHDRIPLGQIVAQVTLDRAISPIPQEMFERFAVRQGIPKWGMPGACHWHLSHVELVTNEIPCRGAQRLWDVPAEVLNYLEFAQTPAAWISKWKELTNSEM